MVQALQECLSAPQSARRQRVLIIEEDRKSMQMLCDGLADAGFRVTTPRTREDARKAIDREGPELVLLDWEHPTHNAQNLIEHIRHGAPPPIARIMALSSYSGEQQIVAGFDLGLDDFVTRPYSMPLLAARARAILRASGRGRGQRDFLSFHRLCMDMRDLRLMVENQIVPLRPMELRLLELLMRHPERVFSRQQVVQRIWNHELSVAERAVDVHVQRTRKTLARFGCGDYLQTVRGFGYRLSVL